jgi:hypothetical protein
MKIEQLTIQQKRLSTAEAELWVFVHVPEKISALQIRGNLIGPFCPNAQTIQIAYTIKPIRPAGVADNILVGRILIPEPNLWTAETPFTYEGNVELWDDGKLADIKPIRAAFKTSAASRS